MRRGHFGIMEERDCFRTQIQVEDISVTSQSQTVSYCDNELLKTSSERIKDLIKSFLRFCNQV